ncbi:terpene synthase family protein [Nocardia sp. NPDC004582]
MSAPEIPVSVPELDTLPPPGHPILALPVRVSRYGDRLESLILDWADSYRLVETARQRQRLAGTRLGELIARTFPFVREDRLEPLAGWFTWAFVIDDWYDGPGGSVAAGHGRALAQVLDALPVDGRHRVEHPGALFRQLAAVWDRMADGQSVQWRLGFVDCMAAFMESFPYEAINRRAEAVPGVVSYAQLRRQSGGITPCLYLLEYAAGREVPGMIRRSDPFQHMFNCAADVVVWVNDVVSLRKELAIGEVTNGVLALAAEQRCGLQDAVAAAYRRVGRIIDEFHCAEVELATLCADWRGLTGQEHRAVRLCVDGMKYWMRGNLDWSMHSERYLQADVTRLGTSATLLAAD